MQFMITNAMKKTLVEELEYKPEEVEVMRPEIAAELIDKRAKRPFGDRPMPDQGGIRRRRRGGGGARVRTRTGRGPVPQPLHMTLTAGFCVGGRADFGSGAVGGEIGAQRRETRPEADAQGKGKKRRKKGARRARRTEEALPWSSEAGSSPARGGPERPPGEGESRTGTGTAGTSRVDLLDGFRIVHHRASNVTELPTSQASC